LRKQELLFLKKSSKKTFMRLASGVKMSQAKTNKSLFVSFSSEKELLA
jgi:hypothetical protein